MFLRSASGLSEPSRSVAPAPIHATVPAIESFLAADPDDGDSAVSIGDTFTITFDAATDRAGGPRQGDRAFVDDMLRFDPPLAADYSGAWTDARTLVVTLVDAAGSLVAVGDSRVSLRQDGVDDDGDGVPGDVSHAGGGIDLAGYEEKLASVQHVVRLDGNFGTADADSEGVGGHVPGIVQFKYSSTKAHGKVTPSWSETDKLLVRFDVAVNVKAGWPLHGNKMFVDSLFGFAHSLGADYSGGWRDASVFVVTALDVTGAAPQIGATSVRVLADIRSLAGTGPSAANAVGSAATNESLVARLSGDFGDQTEPLPAVFLAADPDNSELAYGSGDTLTVAFTKATNRDGSTAERAYVDSLFDFEPQIGDDYSGEWLDDSAFLITVTDTGTHAPTLNASRVSVKGAIFGRDHGRQVALGSSAVMSGSYGSAAPPKISSFVVTDPHQEDGYDAGDVFTIAFDMATNRGHFNPHANTTLDPKANLIGNWTSSGDMEYVGSIFAFSDPLGQNYSGGWRDDSTFVITVLNASESAPQLGVTNVMITNTSELRNRASTSPVSEGIGVELDGHFGTSQPVLTGFTVRGAARAYGAGDVYVVGFDRTTDLGGTRGGKRYVDSLFEFSQPVGLDYSGAWQDDSTFHVVVLDAGSPSAPVNRLTQVQPAGDIHNPARTTQRASRSVAIHTDLSEGITVPPKIALARAYDPINNDTRLGPADEVQIAFDRPTNGLYKFGAVLSNRTYVDDVLQWWDDAGEPLELPLGAAYSAEWRDAQALVVRFGEGIDRIANVTEPAEVSIKLSAGLRTRAQVSLSSTDRARITGDFGSERPPSIVAFSARDFASAGYGYNSGDEMSVGFDRATNLAAPHLAAAGGRALVDGLLSFTAASFPTPTAPAAHLLTGTTCRCGSGCPGCCATSACRATSRTATCARRARRTPSARAGRPSSSAGWARRARCTYAARGVRASAEQMDGRRVSFRSSCRSGPCVGAGRPVARPLLDVRLLRRQAVDALPPGGHALPLPLVGARRPQPAVPEPRRARGRPRHVRRMPLPPPPPPPQPPATTRHRPRHHHHRLPGTRSSRARDARRSSCALATSCLCRAARRTTSRTSRTRWRWRATSSTTPTTRPRCATCA